MSPEERATKVLDYMLESERVGAGHRLHKVIADAVRLAEVEAEAAMKERAAQTAADYDAHMGSAAIGDRIAAAIRALE